MRADRQTTLILRRFRVPFAVCTMSDLLGKFFGKDKDKQGGKSRDKSPAVGDRPASGAGTSASAQGNSAAEFCTLSVVTRLLL